MNITSWKALTAALIVTLIAPAIAQSTVITVTADDLPLGGVQTTNVTAKGFRFSPNCHFDNLDWFGNGVNVIGVDLSGCSTFFNTDFLGAGLTGGAGGAFLFIDFSGNPFALQEMQFFGGSGNQLVSSKGGTFDIAPPPGQFDDIYSYSFSGSEWTDIKWLLWGPTFAGGPNHGIRGFTATVPESGTFGLLGLGLVGLAMTRRLKAR